MKKLFISQPMVDKTDEQILLERENAIKEASEKLGEDVELLDSFFTDFKPDAKPLRYLGASIMKLSEADIAYFAKGWQDYRGCNIEHRCAVDYGIPCLFSEFDPHKTAIGKRLDVGLWD